MLVGTAAKAAATLILGVDVAQRFRRCTPRWTIASDADETAKLIRKVAGDATYWPSPWLGGLLGGHLQSIFYGLNPACPKFECTVDTWQTADGGTIGIAWPEASLPDTAPIVLILPGLCGSVKGTGHTVKAMLAEGLRPAVFHARGCGQALTSPSFNLFGNTDDLREAVAHLKTSFPSAEAITLYSISAGTGLMVRYLGEEGAAGTSSSSGIAAAVANCPGYDIGVCLTRVAYLYDGAYYMGVLKKHWLGGANGEVLEAASPETCERMRAAPDMHSFMVACAPFAVWPPSASSLPASSSSSKGGSTSRRRRSSKGSNGGAASNGGSGSSGHQQLDGGATANAFARFLARSNPMGTAHQIDVPSLILNADDDPICGAINVDENVPSIMAGGGCPKAVLLQYAKGGHCCFAKGLGAQRWGDELGAKFLAAAAAEGEEA